MNIKSLISGSLMLALLASCSSVYKTDQTPDDVYYSPGKPVGEEQQKSNTSQDEYSYNKEDDNYLRMKVQNRTRWSSLDDYSYWNSYNNYSYNGYGYNSYNMLGYSNLYLNFGFDGYYPNYGNYYSYYGGYYPYYGNSYYNPGTYIKYAHYNTGPKPNTGAYLNHTYNNSNYSNGLNTGHGTSGSYYQPQQTGVGRLLRTIVSGGSSSGNTPYTTESYARPMTSSTPSSSPSSSSSSSSSSSAGSSRSTGSSSGGGRAGRN